MNSTYTLADLPAVAAGLIAQHGQRRVWTFTGDLGAGKTTLIQELCRQWGVQGEVTSPTFALIHVYHTAGGGEIVHADLYRLRSADEAENIGLLDYLYGSHTQTSRCLIEWPEVAENLLPQGETLHITLEATPDGQRTLSVQEA